jgi:hypothetical protein
MGISQREGVFNAVTSVLRSNGIKFTEGMNVSKVITKEHRAAVCSELVKGFKSGAITLDTKFDDDELKAYCPGLLSNWLRKDTRLNGGEPYEPKNPGSRTGAMDPTIRNLGLLLKQTTEPRAKAEIQAAIDARKQELAAAKMPKIDVAVIPASLRKYVSAQG